MRCLPLDPVMPLLPQPVLPVEVDVRPEGFRVGRHLAWAVGSSSLIAFGLQPEGDGAIPVCVLHPASPEVCLPTQLQMPYARV